MTKSKFILFLLVLYMSCSDEVTPDDVILMMDPGTNALIADGTSSTKFTIYLNQRGDESLSKIKCKISAGTFKSNKMSEVELTPLKKFDGSIVAEEIIISPISEGKGELKLTIDIHGILDSLIFPVERSIANKIALSADAFSVQANFGSEIKVTGILKNSNDGKVSTKHKVVIYEFINDLPSSGHYRESQLSSNAESKISFIYTPGDVEPNQRLSFISTVLDEKGVGTNIKDTLIVSIVQKE